MAEECRLAFQAACDLIEEKCGMSFDVGGVTLKEVGAIVKVPAEVKKAASSNPELTREERLTAVEEMTWTRGWAGGMCKLVSPELTGAAREECITRLARKLAEKVV